MPPYTPSALAPCHFERFQVAALEQIPIPVVVFSFEHGIVFTNKASYRLFDANVVNVGSPVSKLPIVWAKNLQFIADEIRTDSANATKLPISYAVTILSSSGRQTADVRLTVLQGIEPALWMLTFDNIKLRQDGIIGQNGSNSTFELHHDSIEIDDTRNGTPLRKSTSTSSLDQQVARLREAVYFSHDAAGFLMDADETFCFPNWDGSSEVEPVRLKNGHYDFLDWYTVWDPEFTQQKSLPDWPLVRLNTLRKKEDWYRVGLEVDDRRVVAEVSGDPLHDKDTGAYIGCVLWVHNLGSPEDVMLADAKANLSDYKMICERLPHILWTMTPLGECDYFTSNWYQFTGLTEAESLGTGFMQAIHPDDLASLELDKATTENLTATSNLVTDHLTEARYRKHDGTWQWFAVAARPLLDKDGKILKWYGTLTEIQTLVMERQEADRKKTQMQAMLALADVSLFHLDARLQLCVYQGKPFWTTQPGASVCVNLNETQPGGIPDFEMHARAVMEGTYPWADFEFDLHDRWYKCRLVRDDNRVSDATNLLGCTIDITDQRHKSQLVLENTRLVTERTIALEKNRLKDEFLAHMSHEIRTPIAGVIGMAEILHETVLTDKQNETLSDISNSAKNLLDIVNDILDLSKIDAGKTILEHVEVNVSELIDVVGRSFQHSVRNKPVELKCGEGLPPRVMMMGDPTKLRQIISNLLSNAIKFTAKGLVTLSVSTTPADICFLVTDTGIGINQSTLSKLFTPFVQGDSSTARQFGGTGLGLVICRGLVEMMDGSLKIESEIGKGTTARLMLPRKMSAELARKSPSIVNNNDQFLGLTKPKPNSNVSGNRVGPVTILVVEDNLVNQKFALHLVKKHGYHGVAVGNGQEALDYLTKTSANIALILMDCQMPIMDGYETTKRIRHDDRFVAWKDIPIVALTASAIIGDREKCEAAGMHEYLTKPVSYEQFREVVGKWLPSRTKAQMEADLVQR